MEKKTCCSENGAFCIDFPGRIRDIQAAMAREGFDVYLGSRLRTISWTSDAFCPWRSYVVIPREGLPTLFTFVIDASRVADDTWLSEENVRGYAPLGGQDQITQISDFILDELKIKKGRLAYETGLSNYTPEGNLSQYEYEMFTAALPDFEFANAHIIVDKLSLIKDRGTINRFREASRYTDIGHETVRAALVNGGWRGKTETEIAGIAEHAMRKAGSEWAWFFTAGNEIASGYRTGYAGGACTPATRRELQPGDSLMVDLHAMYKLGLGDYACNYLIAPVTDRMRWHARNYLDVVKMCIDNYKAGTTPLGLANTVMQMAEERGFVDYVVPGFEHGIGMMGDEWRIGLNTGPIKYWTDPNHVYQSGEMLICAVQYACPEEGIGFRYECPILIREDDCELMAKFPLDVEEIE